MGVAERYNARFQASSQASSNDEKKRIGVAERYKARQWKQNSPQITKRLTKWFDENELLFKEYSSRFDNDNTDKYQSDYNAYFERTQDRRAKLIDEATEIKNEIFEYKDIIGQNEADELLSSMNSYLSQGTKVYRDATQNKDYWSQWENETAYNRYKKIADEEKRINAMSADEIKSEIERLETEKESKGSNAQYWLSRLGGAFAGKPFDEENEKTNDERKNIEQRIQSLKSKKYEKESAQALDSLPKDIIELLDHYNNEQAALEGQQYIVMGNNSMMNQKAIAGHAQSISNIEKEFEKLGYKDYRKLAEYRRLVIDKQEAQKEAEETAKFAGKHPVLASAASVLMAPTKALGALEMIKSVGYETDAPLNTNSPYFTTSRMVNTIRGTVQDNYDWSVGGVDAFDFLYGTGMSMIDSLSAAALGGGSAALGGAIIGSQAMVDTAADITQRGGSKNKAIIGGAFAGIFESFFETVSIGQFNKMAEKGVKNIISAEGIKETIKNMGKSTLVNASEETATEIANLIYDTLANGGASQYATQLNHYLAQGMSEQEAKSKVAKELAMQVVEAGAGGALMGGFMGGLGSTMGSMNYNSDIKAVGQDIIQKGGAEKLVNESLALDSGSQAYRLAERLNGVTQPSAKQIGRLDEAVTEEKTNQKKLTIKKAIEERLIELRVDSTKAADLSNYIVKSITGQKLKKSESEAIRNSKQAQRVFNEYAEHFGGNVSSKWVNDLYNNLSGGTQAAENTASEAGSEAKMINTNKDSALNIAADTHDMSVSGSGNTVVTETGEVVNITKIENVKDGEIKVRLDNGDVVDIRDLSLRNDDEALVYAYASNFPTKAAKAFIENYTDGQSIDNYARIFNTAYQYGYNGLGLQNAMLNINDFNNNSVEFDSEKAELAYSLGENAKTEDVNLKQSGLNKAVNAARAGGKTVTITKGKVTQINKALSQRQAAAVKALNKISAVTGIDFVLFESEVDESGRRIGANGYYKDGKIFLDIEAGYNAEQAILRTASHDLTHFIKEWSPAQYENMQEYLLSTFMLKGDVTIEILVNSQISKAKNSKTNPRSLTYEQALEEVVAEACEMMLKDSEAIEELAVQNKTLAEKIKEWIDDFVKAVAQAFRSIQAHSLEAQILEQYADEAKTLQIMWDEALKNAVEARAAVGAEKNTAESGEVKYSTRESFEEQVEKVINGDNFIKTHLYAGTTPEILKQFGFKPLPLLITRKHIKNITTPEDNIHGGFHGLSKKQIVKAVKAIANPIVVLSSHKNNGALVIVTDVIDNNNRLITVYIKPDGKGYHLNIEIDANIILSIYGRNGISGYIGDALLNDRVLFWDKKRSQQLANIPRVQFPNNVPTVDFNKSISNYKTLVNNIISENSEKNTKTFKTDEEQVKFAKEEKSVKLSDRDDTEDRAALQSNAKLSERDDTEQYPKRIAELEELVSALEEEFKLTNHKADKKSIERMGRKMLREYQSNYDLREFADKYEELHNYIVDNIDDLVWEDIFKKAEKIAKPIIENAKTEIDVYHRQILQDLRQRKFRLSDAQKAEVVHHFGSLKEFTNRIIGNTRYTTDTEAMTLDEFWDELVNLYPAHFKSDINDLDMAIELTQVIARLRNEHSVHMGYESEITHELALRLFDEYFNVPEVKTFADKKQRQYQLAQAQYHRKLEKYREQVKEIRRQKNEAVEAALKKGRQDIKKLRHEKNEQFNEMAKKYREAARKKVERNKMTEIRNKIKKHILKLSSTLEHGTDKKHIPTTLLKTVKTLCEAVTVDYKAGVTIKEKLQAFEDAYESMEHSEDYLLEGAFEGPLYKEIHELRLKLGDKTLSEFTLDELQQVYELVLAVTKSVSNANKAFIAEKGETISSLSEEVSAQLRSKKQDERLHLGKVIDYKREFDWAILKPIYAFRKVGSETLTKLYKNISRGQDVWARDVQESKQKYQECAQKYNRNKWDLEKRNQIRLEKGGTVQLTVDEMLTLYIWHKREQAARHLKLGGFVQESSIIVTKKEKLIPVMYDIARSDARQVTESDIAIIKRLLTQEQMAYADEMQKYLAVNMGAKGNEISLALYDIEKFIDAHYFPVRSANEFLAKFNNTKDKNHIRMIKNSGFTKDLIPDASNPIILRGFNEIWAEHCNQMALYHAFTLPIEDFYKVYNSKTRVSELYASESVKALLQNAYGKEALGYIEKLLIDINGGIQYEKALNLPQKLISNFKKGATFASLSVAIQQPSAIGRAMALIDMKYFTKTVISRRDWNEVKKYAPIAVIKEMGHFDTNTGGDIADWITADKYNSFKEKMTALGTDSKYRDDVLSRLPQFMDEIAWCHIWNACKAEVADKAELKVNSEEFYKAAADRFTDIIDMTQVYDSVFSRSEIMRSKDTLYKMATSFMAEPLTSINMLIDAVNEKKNNGKAGAQYARKAIGAYILSVVMNALLKSIVTAARDDEEDKTYIEKYAGKVTGEIWESIWLMNLLPFVKDAVSIWKGYNIERADMNLISDLIDSIKAIGSENKSVYEKIEGFAGSAAAFFGLPVKNVLRDVRSVYNLCCDFLSDNVTTWAGIELSALEELGINVGSKTDRLYKAIIKGDEEQYKRLTKDAKSIDTMIRKGLRENDLRIAEAAQARIDGDFNKYKTLVKEVIADGFSQDNVVAAVNSEMTAMRKETSEQKAEPETESKEQKAISIYHYSDLNMAIASGDTNAVNEMMRDFIDIGIENGKSEKDIRKTIRSQVTLHWKPLYVEADTQGRAEIRRMLYDTGIYGSLSELDNALGNWAETQ